MSAKEKPKPKFKTRVRAKPAAKVSLAAKLKKSKPKSSAKHPHALAVAKTLSTISASPKAQYVADIAATLVDPARHTYRPSCYLRSPIPYTTVNVSARLTWSLDTAKVLYIANSNGFAVFGDVARYAPIHYLPCDYLGANNGSCLPVETLNSPWNTTVRDTSVHGRDYTMLPLACVTTVRMNMTNKLALDPRSKCVGSYERRVMNVKSADSKSDGDDYHQQTSLFDTPPYTGAFAAGAGGVAFNAINGKRVKELRLISPGYCNSQGSQGYLQANAAGARGLQNFELYGQPMVEIYNDTGYTCEIVVDCVAQLAIPLDSSYAFANPHAVGENEVDLRFPTECAIVLSTVGGGDTSDEAADNAHSKIEPHGLTSVDPAIGTAIRFGAHGPSKVLHGNHAPQPTAAVSRPSHGGFLSSVSSVIKKAGITTDDVSAVGAGLAASVSTMEPMPFLAAAGNLVAKGAKGLFETIFG